jgi:hypothetical protein
LVLCKFETWAVDADSRVGVGVVTQWRLEVFGETGAEIIFVSPLRWVEYCAFADELYVGGRDLELLVVGTSFDDDLGAWLG